MVNYLLAVIMIRLSSLVLSLTECDTLTLILSSVLGSKSFVSALDEWQDDIVLLAPDDDNGSSIRFRVVPDNEMVLTPGVSSGLVVVVVVVVVATIEAVEASIFIVILKCFFCTCVRISWTREKARSHTGHLVLPECMSRWRVRDIGCLNPFQQILHRNWNSFQRNVGGSLLIKEYQHI